MHLLYTVRRVNHNSVWTDNTPIPENLQSAKIQTICNSMLINSIRKMRKSNYYSSQKYGVTNNFYNCISITFEKHDNGKYTPRSHLNFNTGFCEISYYFVCNYIAGESGVVGCCFLQG